DPAQVLAGLLATEEDVARLRVDLGLNQPLHVQYGVFLERLPRGNLRRPARGGPPAARPEPLSRCSRSSSRVFAPPSPWPRLARPWRRSPGCSPAPSPPRAPIPASTTCSPWRPSSACPCRPTGSV